MKSTTAGRLEWIIVGREAGSGLYLEPGQAKRRKKTAIVQRMKIRRGNKGRFVKLGPSPRARRGRARR